MKKMVVIADNLMSAHNVGSLFRTCEGLGVDKIYLTGYTPYPKSKSDVRLPHLARKIDLQIHKTSLDAEKYIKWQHVDNIEELIQKLKNKSFKIVAVEQSKSSKNIKDVKIKDNTALIFGNEKFGIQNNVLKLADATIHIPMLGKKESFNVVQTAAMVIFKIMYFD